MLAEPKCFTRGCKHFTGVKNFAKAVEGDERPVCKAFPGGIPSKIAYGPILHTKPYEGDHGIQFEEA